MLKDDRIRLIPTILIPLIIFLASFLLRLSLISKGPYSGDCMWLVMQIERGLAEGRMMYLLGTGYPMTIIAGTASTLFFSLTGLGDTVYAVNFMSVIFTAGATLFLFLFVRRLFDQLTALFSVLLFSLSPIVLYVSVYGTSHSPAIFFFTLSLYLMVVAKERGSILYLYLSAITMGCFGASRLHEFVLVFLSILFFLKFVKLPNQEKTFSFKQIIIFILIGCITTVLIHLPIMVGSISKEFWAGWASYRNTSFAPIHYWPYTFLKVFKYIYLNFSLLGCIFIISGALFLAKRNLRLLVFLLIWLLIPISFFSISINTIPRFLMPILPPLAILFGYTCSYLLQSSKKLTLIIVPAATYVIITIFCFVYPQLYFRSQKALLPDFVRWFEKVSDENSVIITMDEDGYFRYFGTRQTIPKARTDTYYNEEELKGFIKKILEFSDSGKTIYITGYALANYDTKKIFFETVNLFYEYRRAGGHLTEFWYRGPFKHQAMWSNLYRLERKKN